MADFPHPRRSLRILHVEDNSLDAEITRDRIHQEWPGAAIARVDNRPDFLTAVARDQFDLILSDFSMPRFNGLEALEIARAQQAATPFMFLSGTIGEDHALQAMRSGATDYVLKDRPGRLIMAIQRALDRREEMLRRKETEQHLRHQSELLEQAKEFIRGIDRTPPAQRTAPPSNGLTILVIDDEDGVRHIVQALLHSQGYRTLGANDGAHGLALYQRHQSEIDAVLTDVMMPGMTIDRLLASLRAANPDVRIVTMSGMLPESFAVTFEPGRLQFLAKPMGGPELFQALREVLPVRRG